MSSRHKLEALVLSRRNVGEADRLVTFFTRSHGLMRAVAKGVRKIPSRRGGHLEPFSLVSALVSVSRAGSYVSATETIDYFTELHASEETFTQARNMAMVITGLFEEGQAHASLFDALVEAWRYLPRLDKSKQSVLEVALVMHALREAGLKPDLRMCAACAVSRPSESIVLDAKEGGWRCLLCHGSFRDAQVSLSPDLLKVLRFVQAYPQKAPALSLTFDEALQLLSAVRYYVSYVLEKPLIAVNALYA